MHRIALAVVLTLSLVGCAGAPRGEASPPPNAGRTALSVIGTPFLIAFKIPVCFASAAIAVPLASAAQLAGTEQGARLEDNLGDGLERNCGPPYVLTP